jgi:diguanylate cyclase (GGDEF)-like protein
MQAEELKDPLTGAYSRAALDDRLVEEVERARRYGREVSVLLVDVDHFKSVNDAFGHLRGDDVLTDCVERLTNGLRRTDLLFRYGGDEFVVLLPNAPKDQALHLADRLLRAVRSEPFGDNPPLNLSLSIGTATFPEEADTPEALLEKSDLRLYEAKRQGRDRVVARDPAHRPTLPPETLSRLIERERAMQVLQRFLDAWPDAGRAMLMVVGPRGSGRARFLTEAAEVARVRGHRVLEVQATPALKTRPYGALREALRGLDGDSEETPVGDPAASLRRALQSPGRADALVTVDDLPYLDRETCRELQDLFLSPDSPRLALVCATTPDNVHRPIPVEVALREVVELEPLSGDGVRVWLRNLLQWEPPGHFSVWMRRETGGFPAYLWRGLSYLVERGVLTKTHRGWTFTRDYAEVPLTRRLGVQLAEPASRLPMILTSFIGRDQETRQIERLLEECRLLTLVGPGGIGKTRLAIQSASERGRDFRDGVYVVSLAAVSDVEHIVPAVAEAMGFVFRGESDHTQQLLEYLREKEVLLVLDNFEHLLSHAVLLTQMLGAAPSLRILATSRERLNLQGESVLELSGLPYPPTDEAENPEHYDAVQLFLRTARMAHVDLSLSDDDKAAIVRICRLVRGMPLAIELAASWVRTLSCGEILQELERSTDFLRSTLRDAPERHRSLRGVFRSSWELLGEEERKVCRKLSIFRGGFTREAAAHVAEAPFVLVHTLREKSLVQTTGTGRYEILEVLRQFVEQELTKTPDLAADVRDRHCAYFADLLVGYGNRLRGERQRETLDAIAQDIDNIRSACRWSLTQGKHEQLGKLLSPLFSFYMTRSWYREADELLATAAEHLRQRGEDTGRDTALLGKVLHMSGTVKGVLGESEAAQKALHESEELLYGLYADAEATTDRAGIGLELATAVTQASQVYRDAGDLAKAEEKVRRALELLETLPAAEDPVPAAVTCAQAEAVNTLGTLHYGKASYDEARTCFARAQAMYDSISETKGAARAACNMGGVCYMRGEYAEAADHFERYLSASEELGDKSNAAQAAGNLGAVLHQQGEYARAEEAYQRYLRICEELGNKRGAGVACGNLGLVHYMRGAYDRAMSYYQRKLSISQELGDQHGIGVASSHLGLLHHARGEHEKASEYHAQHLEIAEQRSDRQAAAVATRNLGAARNAMGDRVHAARLLKRSLTISREVGSKQDIALSLQEIASVRTKAGRYEEARAAICEAREIFKETGSKFGLAELANLQAELNLKDGSALDVAERNARESLRLAASLGLKALKASALLCLGRVCARAFREGAPDMAERRQEARLHLERAIRLLETLGKRQELAEAWLEYGKLLGDGGSEEAARYLELARQEFERLGLPAQAADVPDARTEHP